MIRRLIALADPGQARDLRLAVALMTVSAALMGALLGLLLPTLRALFTGADATAPLLALLALTALYGLTHHAAMIKARRAGYGLCGMLLDRLGDHVVRLPLGWFRPARVGPFGRLAGAGVMNILQTPAHLLEPLAGATVAPAVTIAVLAVTDWRMGLAALAVAPLIWLAARWMGDRITAADHDIDAATADLGARTVEFAQTQPVLRAAGRTGKGLELLTAAVDEHRRATSRRITTALPALTVLGLSIQGAFAALLVAAAAIATDLDAAALVTAMVLASRYVEPMRDAAAISAVLRMSANSLDRLEQVLATPPLPQPARSAPLGEPSIELERVSFSYNDTPLLEDVSLTVSPGTVTALVGPSGAGKTTILHLVARFFDVSSGSVRVAGADVRELTFTDLMAQVALVSQDVYLFEGTLEDNIRLSRPEASQEEVRRAAALARCDEIAERLPGGWSGQVGERGAALSGGERQRVSIARALLKDAPIVLLDEATSALDAENEAAVVAAVRALAQRRTVLMVAHRLNTVRHADQIVVLDGGRVAEHGTHQDLLAAGGLYTALWKARDAASGWRVSA
ncbi:ABC transporter ATP-binding protein [Nonomuraea sp. NPDC059194]|uniref:ABC transporter ATP-binding protein n=1 Tax=Nonomuraea sp. NPDC059194 TaxID=3346764 RepID=UPI0036903C5F